RSEVGVAEHVRDDLERARHPLHEPVLIDATELAEQVFRRGEEALDVCDEQRCGAIQLISTRGAVPLREHAGATLAIAAWPLEFAPLEQLFASASGTRWGVVVPVIYPVTTNVEAIRQLADAAHAKGATFFAPLPVELDATAKHELASSLGLDEEAYTKLFHAELAPLHLEAERAICGIAAEQGMADFLVPPQWERKTNWNAAVFLKLCAARMLAMEQDLDVATTIARSAAVVASLDKSVERVAAAASLSIVEGLDATSVEMLHEWLREGRSEFADAVDEQWRL
ncbi:MAG TPA: hypothetical protein VF698_19795, partial [Thermoanaerobaculia bacterium]